MHNFTKDDVWKWEWNSGPGDGDIWENADEWKLINSQIL